MGLSRSPLEFLMRSGINPDETFSPGPRLNITDLLVNTLPTPSPPTLSETVLRDYEGGPPPDRAQTQPWPNQKELQ